MNPSASEAGEKPRLVRQPNNIFNRGLTRNIVRVCPRLQTPKQPRPPLLRFNDDFLLPVFLILMSSSQYKDEGLPIAFEAKSRLSEPRRYLIFEVSAKLLLNASLISSALTEPETSTAATRKNGNKNKINNAGNQQNKDRKDCHKFQHLYLIISLNLATPRQIAGFIHI